MPLLCHFQRAVDIGDQDPYAEITRYLAVQRGAVPTAFTTLSYFDGVNFAKRASAPALFSIAPADFLISAALAAQVATVDGAPTAVCLTLVVAIGQPAGHHDFAMFTGVPRLHIISREPTRTGIANGAVASHPTTRGARVPRVTRRPLR